MSSQQEQAERNIYEFRGIVVSFFSEHCDPVTVLGRLGALASTAEFVVSNGQIVSIKIRPAPGCEPIAGAALTDFKQLTERYRDQIIGKWIDHFVLHKPVDCDKI